MKTGITVPCTKRIESCRETRKETYTKWNKVLGCLSYTLCVYVVVVVSSTAHFGSVESMHISAAIEQMIHAYILWKRGKKICKISCAVVRWKTTDITGSNSNIEMYTIYFNILTDCVSVCIHGVHSVRKTYLSAGIYLLWIESTGFVYFCFLFVSFLYSRMNIGARLE